MYSAQDKYEMTLRQTRVDIGQGRGNSLSKAVDLCNASGRKFISDKKRLDWIFRTADELFYFNQQKIESDYHEWRVQNEDALKAELGLEMQVVDNEHLDFPQKQ